MPLSRRSGSNGLISVITLIPAGEMMPDGSAYGAVAGDRVTTSDSSDDKKYLQCVKRIVGMCDEIIADSNDGADSGDANRASHGIYDAGLSPEQRMRVGMEAVIGMMHTERGLDRDLDTVHDVLA